MVIILYRATRALPDVTKLDVRCIGNNICSTVVYFDLLRSIVKNNHAMDRLMYFQRVNYTYFSFYGTTANIPVIASPFI